MKTVIDLNQYAETLAKWRGAYARVWIFDVSLTRLAVKLKRRGEPEVLYIVGVNCEHITGPFSWSDSEISISLKSESGGPYDLVMDKTCGFELQCLSVGLVRGPSTDFDKTFDNFLGDAPVEPTG